MCKEELGSCPPPSERSFSIRHHWNRHSIASAPKWHRTVRFAHRGPRAACEIVCAHSTTSGHLPEAEATWPPIRRMAEGFLCYQYVSSRKEQDRMRGSSSKQLSAEPT